MTDAANFDIDALLEGTLDDLADLPEFRPFNPGVYRMTLDWEFDKTKKSVIYMKFKILETQEEVVPQDGKPMEPGAETNVRLDLSNEFGQGRFKEIMAVAAARYGAKSNRELLAELKGNEILGATKHNVNKKDGKVYTDLVEMQII